MFVEQVAKVGGRRSRVRDRQEHWRRTDCRSKKGDLSVALAGSGMRATLAKTGRLSNVRADELVGEKDEAVTDGFAIDQAHGFAVAALAEQALPGPEHDWEDDHPQLVDQVI